MDRLTFAKFYAATRHAGQTYGVLPYTHHLEDAEEVLRRFGPLTGNYPTLVGDYVVDRFTGRLGEVQGFQEANEPWHAGGCPIVTPVSLDPHSGAYWHDAVVVTEETPTIDDMLCAVWLHDIVEDTPTKLRDVEENFGETTARLVGAVTSEEGPSRKVRNALTYPKIRTAGPHAVRLKLADRIANIENGGSNVSKYRDEHEDFRRALYTQGENEDMWNHLDSLFGIIRRKI